ncbi:hypothetical protein KY285_035696 [Solanum tuberosum]|nr:hypothetical protein KY285_035696 [Solanum tuberosum]
MGGPWRAEYASRPEGGGVFGVRSVLRGREEGWGVYGDQSVPRGRGWGVGGPRGTECASKEWVEGSSGRGV